MKYKSNYALQYHTNSTHKAAKDHKCQICNQSFSNIQQLKNHVRSNHETEKKFKCSLCQSSFAFNGNLRYGNSEYES